MNNGDASVLRTRASLLFRLQLTPGDQGAWDQFAAHYGPMVLGWCKRWGLQDADAADVTQDVLTRLTQKLPEFRYDPSKRFRGWLKTVTQHALLDFHRGAARRYAGSGDSGVLAMLDQMEAREDLAERLQSAFDLELLEEAYREVQERVAERTWQAFYLTAVQGLSGSEAAARLGMNASAVFVAKSNVQAMLREIIQRCETEP